MRRVRATANSRTVSLSTSPGGITEIGSFTRSAMSPTAKVNSCAATFRNFTFAADSSVMKPTCCVPSFSLITSVAKPCAIVLFGSRIFCASSVRL